MTPHELFGPAARQDPFPTYDRLRGRGPVRVGAGRWALLDHEDVRAALGDPQAFSSDLGAQGNPVFDDSPLIFDDPPRHTSFRRLVGQAFTPRRVALLAGQLSSLACGLFDEMGPGPVDLIAGYCDPFPTRVIARLLGVPPDAYGRLKQWSRDRTFVAYHGDRGAQQTPELEAAERGRIEFRAYLLSLVAERRAEPQDDLLSALVEAEDDGSSLTDQEIASIGGVVLSAGNVTTTRLLGNLFHHVASDPQLVDRLRSDRALVGPLIEEMLRLESPVQFPARTTTRDVELSGTIIPVGSFVMIGLGAANRDGAVYPEPTACRPGGRPPHLAFGHGIHYCAGAALARQEASITLDILLDRFDGIELVGEATRETGLAHRGWASLVVTLVPPELSSGPTPS
jgi:cytochrome P450